MPRLHITVDRHRTAYMVPGAKHTVAQIGGGGGEGGTSRASRVRDQSHGKAIPHQIHRPDHPGPNRRSISRPEATLPRRPRIPHTAATQTPTVTASTPHA